MTNNNVSLRSARKQCTEMDIFNSLPDNPDFNNLEKTFENLVGKGKMLVIDIFSFSHDVFCPFRNNF